MIIHILSLNQFELIRFYCINQVLVFDLFFFSFNLLKMCDITSPKDEVLSLSQGLSSHSLMTSSASTAQVVSSIVDDGETNMRSTSSINSPGLLTTLNSPREPTTNNIINLLATTSNNPECFETNNGHSSSSAILHHPLATQPHPQTQTQLTPGHSVDSLDPGSRSGVHLLESQGVTISHRNSHSHNNNSSPVPTSERIDHLKIESLENGGNDTSPKYISL